MAHFLDASQLAEACCELELTEELRAIEKAAQAAGEAIARKLGIEVVSEADTQPGFGGLCVGFGPAHDGQPCPEVILAMDDCSEWGDETRDGKTSDVDEEGQIVDHDPQSGAGG